MFEKIKIFDALSKLIPGIVLMSFFLPFSIIVFELGTLFKSIATDYKELSTLLTTIFLVFSYLVGYYISATASASEDYLFKSWGGRASSLLLSNKVKKALTNREEIFKFLVENANNENLKNKTLEECEDKDFRLLFQLAKNYNTENLKDSKFSERIEDFFNAYIFSRNILFSFIFIVILAFFLLIKMPIYPTGLGIALIMGLTILSYTRCRNQSIYHTREVFTAAYSHFKNKTTK